MSEFNVSFETDQTFDADFESVIALQGETANYKELYNKPQINNVELTGNKTFDDLGMEALSNIELHGLLQ